MPRFPLSPRSPIPILAMSPSLRPWSLPTSHATLVSIHTGITLFPVSKAEGPSCLQANLPPGSSAPTSGHLDAPPQSHLLSYWYFHSHPPFLSPSPPSVDEDNHFFPYTQTSAAPQPPLPVSCPPHWSSWQHCLFTPSCPMYAANHCLQQQADTTSSQGPTEPKACEGKKEQ